MQLLIMCNLQSSKEEDPSNSLQDKVSHQRQLCNTTEPQVIRSNNLNNQDKYEQKEIQNEATTNEEIGPIETANLNSEYERPELQDQEANKFKSKNPKL